MIKHIWILNVIFYKKISRKDSTIVAPYEKWEYYDPRIKQMEQDRNFALNKTKKVAWFVSNCGARNGRLNYAHELRKYIQVIFKNRSSPFNSEEPLIISLFSD